MPGMGIGPGTAFRQDILAARPPAVPSLQGFFFFATDVNGGTLYQCDGASWVAITGGITNLIAGSGISIVSGVGTETISVSIFDALTFVINGGGSAISTGIVGDLVVPFNCIINQVTLLADQLTNLIVDVWKASYANYPPVVGNSITASTKPTITAASKYQSSSLTGWTTSIASGDVLRFNVDVCSAATLATIALKVTRT